MYDTIPFLQYGYCLQYPHNARLLGKHMRLSFARPLCNHPFYKPLHPPGLRPSPFLSILQRMERKGEQSNHIYVVSDIARVNGTPSVGLCPPAPPCRTCALLRSTRGAMHTQRHISQIFEYIVWNSVGSGLVSDLNLRTYRVSGPSSRKA